MMSLSDDKQADIIDAFNTTSRYLDDILNNNKTNTSDTKAAFLDLHLSIFNDIISTKTYVKRDDFEFEIFRRWCYSLYILWSLYLSTHSFLAMLLTSTLAINC